MSDESVEGLVTLTERTVNLINQLSMPLVEVSLVIQKHMNQLMDTLTQHLEATGETVHERILKPWPLDNDLLESESTFALDKVMNIIDQQRMDILDTLIRVTLEEEQMLVSDALGVMRSWEHLARNQLSQAAGPGQLFSPTEIPDDF